MFPIVDTVVESIRPSKRLKRHSLVQAFVASVLGQQSHNVREYSELPKSADPSIVTDYIPSGFDCFHDHISYSVLNLLYANASIQQCE